MKTRTAIIAACAGTLVLANANIALAAVAPIPGVDIVVRKDPGGTAIKVGACQAGGGKVVKVRGQWACTGLPAATKQKRSLDIAPGRERIRFAQSQTNSNSKMKMGTQGDGVWKAPAGVESAKAASKKTTRAKAAAKKIELIGVAALKPAEF